MLISFLSTLMMTRPVTFAMLYSFGNIVALMSTGFLVGPKRQIKAACARKRVIATVVFLAAIIGTILSAVYVKSVLLIIGLVIVQ